jgi:chromate transporter
MTTRITQSRGSVLEVLGVATRLGLTSFGGPIAHIGYFRAEYVDRRKWVDEATFADLVALAQFLPGPASSQLGIALGIIRAGVLGGFAAWLGFTLPSAIALAVFAMGVVGVGAADAGWLHGLKVVAVAVVAQAVWGMGRSLCPDRPRITLAIVSAVIVLAWPLLRLPPALSQLAVILLGAVVGWQVLREPAVALGTTHEPLALSIGRRTAVCAWTVFVALLLVLPVVRPLANNQTLSLVDSFFRAGALVFGGGHVVLPLLQSEVVPPGWVTPEQFLAGYGAAQAVPGPLFTFAAYLGAASSPAPNGALGATIALVAIFAPAILLVFGSLPFWEALRKRADAQAVLRGVNAAVVGLLLAALYDPVWTGAIERPADFALALVAFGLLMFWRTPPWAVVILAACAGAIIG